MVQAGQQGLFFCHLSCLLLALDLGHGLGQLASHLPERRPQCCLLTGSSRTVTPQLLGRGVHQPPLGGKGPDRGLLGRHRRLVAADGSLHLAGHGTFVACGHHQVRAGCRAQRVAQQVPAGVRLYCLLEEEGLGLVQLSASGARLLPGCFQAVLQLLSLHPGLVGPFGELGQQDPLSLDLGRQLGGSGPVGGHPLSRRGCPP